MSLVRFAALTLAIVLLTGCGSMEYEKAIDGVADGTHLRKLGIDKNDVKMQAPCELGINSGTLSCAFVETGSDIYFLKYSYKTSSYEPLIHLNIQNIPEIAYATFGLGRQVQIKTGKRWMGFHIIGSTFADTEATRGIYDRLVARGIPSTEPQPFINMQAPIPVPITIYY
jgi:hypothetical protein